IARRFQLRDGHRLGRKTLLAYLDERRAEVVHQPRRPPPPREIQLPAQLEDTGVLGFERLQHQTLCAVADQVRRLALIEQSESKVGPAPRSRAPQQLGAQRMERSNAGFAERIADAPPKLWGGEGNPAPLERLAQQLLAPAAARQRIQPVPKAP